MKLGTEGKMLRGEVWLVNLDPTVDSEIRKTRPWIVGIEPNSDNGLMKLSAADTFQIRSVAESRLIERIGCVGDRDLVLIEKALAIVLKIRYIMLFRSK